MISSFASNHIFVVRLVMRKSADRPNVALHIRPRIGSFPVLCMIV